jgi:RNA polymerase sigma-70 factor, ECF subfamily
VIDPGALAQLQGVGTDEAQVPHASPEPREALGFPQVFEEHFDYVWTALRRLGIHDRDVEDLTHDTFVRVYQRFTRYDPERPVRPWLFGFALRVAADFRRLARNRFEILTEKDDATDAAPTALERLIDVQDLELARAALESLELNRRAVFILHELDGYSMPEIASALELPLGTASSRLRLARGEFQAAARRLLLRRGER